MLDLHKDMNNQLTTLIYKQIDARLCDVNNEVKFRMSVV